MIDSNQPDSDINNPQSSRSTAGKSLSQIADLVKNSAEMQGRRIPPVDQWNPQYCGTMNLVVKSNGEWWHEGSQIKREALIKLFSSVLWREDETYFLKTPVEKIQIQVEDVPLLVTQIDQVEQDGKLYLRCSTQTDDVIVVDAEHPIFMRDYQGQMRPYVRVRWGLEALVQRSAFYHLINFGEFFEQGEQTGIRLSSGDYQFSLLADTFSDE